MLCNANTPVLVTGGASGLGRGTAEHLAELGCPVIVLDLDETIDPVADTAGVQHIGCDITCGDAVDSAVRQVLESVGAPRVVVNCAGVAPAGRTVSRDGAHDMALFERVIAVNLAGSFRVASAFAAHMVALEPRNDNERGVIINTASVAAWDGQVGQCAYAASKAGIVGLTLPMARDLAPHGIRVCAIAPGIFATPMIDAMPSEVQESLIEQVPFPRRLGRPEDYAALVQHVIENRLLNGEVIRLDGALRMAAR